MQFIKIKYIFYYKNNDKYYKTLKKKTKIMKHVTHNQNIEEN